MENLKSLLSRALEDKQPTLVEDKESVLGKECSKLIGPPEPSFGPSGPCPRCSGTLIYLLASDRHICIDCWRVFKEE